MTLDPVHVDGIARLAERISGGVDGTDQRRIAETVWSEFLDPLYGDDGAPVLEPLGEQSRRLADVESVALEESAFPTAHGVDAGTINPTTFTNGLVVDVSQAAMAAVPTDLELHRARTIVMTAHTNDDAFTVSHDDWTVYDEGYVRKRVLHAPRVDRYEQNVVHALALYLAESRHAIDQAGVVEDLLILDGPIYPTGLLQWVQRDSELAGLLETEPEPKDIVANYLRLVERFVDRDVPLIGFVKNNTSKAITGTVRRSDAAPNAPWANDAAFFRRVLSRDGADGTATDALTFTNWFVSRIGTDRVVAALSAGPSSNGEGRADDSADDGARNHSSAAGADRSGVGGFGADALGIDRELSADAYEVTFFVVYDPRDDLIYRVEAPYAFTSDPDCRERIARYVLSEIAAERGPPLAVAKADELARIDKEGKEQLTRRIERTFEADRQNTYDDERWGAFGEVL